MPLEGEQEAEKLAEAALTSADSFRDLLDQMARWGHGSLVAWRIPKVIREGNPHVWDLDVVVPWALEILDSEVTEERSAARMDVQIYHTLEVVELLLRGHLASEAHARFQTKVDIITRWVVEGWPRAHVDVRSQALNVLAKLPWLDSVTRQVVLAVVLDPNALPKPRQGRRQKPTELAQTLALEAALLTIEPSELPEAALAAAVQKWASGKKYEFFFEESPSVLWRFPSPEFREAVMSVAAGTTVDALHACCVALRENHIDGSFLLPTIETWLGKKRAAADALEGLFLLAQDADGPARALVAQCTKSGPKALRKAAKEFLEELEE